MEGRIYLYILVVGVCLVSPVVPAIPSSSTLIFFNNSVADQCSYKLTGGKGCAIEDPAVWEGGVVPSFNSSLVIGYNNSDSDIYLYVDFDTPVYDTIYLYHQASLFVNSSGSLKTRIIEGQEGTGFLIVSGQLNASVIHSSNISVVGGTIIGDTIGEGVLTLVNATALFETCVLTTLYLNNSVVSAILSLTTTNLYLFGQNSFSILGDSAYADTFVFAKNVEQQDIDDITSYTTFTTTNFGQDSFTNGDFVLGFDGTSIRAVFNIYPRTTITIEGQVTIMPYPNNSNIASVFGGGYFSTISDPSSLSSVLISPVPFASNITLSPAGEIKTPYIEYPTLLKPWQPSFIDTSLVSSSIYSVFNYSSESLNISGDVITKNLVVSIGFANPSLLVQGNLTVEGNITVVETVANATFIQCQSSGEVMIVAANNTVISNTAVLEYVPLFSDLYSNNNFMWSLIERNGSIYVRYNSTIDCHSHDGRHSFPRWAIYLIAIGGGGVLGLTMVAYLIYARRRSGYESLPVVPSN